MRRRSLVLVIVVAGLSAAVSFAVRSRTPPPPPPPEDPQIQLARGRAKALTVPAALPPFVLAAKTSPAWTCEPSPQGAHCQSDQWTVLWRIAQSASAEPLDAVLARLRPVRPRDPENNVVYLGEHTLAGFRGTIRMMDGGKRPVLVYDFTGWLDVAGHGRLQLDIEAASTRWTDDRDRLDGLAVMLETTMPAGGLSPAWLATLPK